MYLCIYLYIYLSIYLSAISLSLSINLSTCIYLSLSLYLSIYLTLSLTLSLSLSQAARVTRSGVWVKKTALEIRSRPYIYKDTPQLELDSFVTYCSNLNMTVCSTDLINFINNFVMYFLISMESQPS